MDVFDKTKWPDLSVSLKDNLTQSVNSGRNEKETFLDSISVHLNKLKIEYDNISTIATKIKYVLKQHQSERGVQDRFKLLVTTFSQIGVIASQVNVVASNCTYQLETISTAKQLTNYASAVKKSEAQGENVSRKESQLRKDPSSDREALENPTEVACSSANANENTHQAPVETTAQLDQPPPTAVSPVEDQPTGNDTCSVLEPVPSTSASSIQVPSTSTGSGASNLYQASIQSEISTTLCASGQDCSPSSELVSSTSVSEQDTHIKVPDTIPSTDDVNPAKETIQNLMEIESSQPHDSFQTHVETETLEQPDDNTVGHDMPLSASRKRKNTAPNPPEDGLRRSCRRIVPPTLHDGDVRVDWNGRATRKKITAKDGVKKSPRFPSNSKNLPGGNDQPPQNSSQDHLVHVISPMKTCAGSTKIRWREPLEEFSNDVPTIPPAPSTQTVPEESSTISVTEGGNQKKKTTKPKRKSNPKEDLHSAPNREEAPATPVNSSLNSSMEESGPPLNSAIVAGEPSPQPESCSKEPSGGPILMRFKKISTGRVESVLVSEPLRSGKRKRHSIQSEISSPQDDVPFAVQREESEPPPSDLPGGLCPSKRKLTGSNKATRNKHKTLKHAKLQTCNKEKKSELSQDTLAAPTAEEYVLPLADATHDNRRKLKHAKLAIANEGDTSCESSEAPIVNDISKNKAGPSAQIEEKVQNVGRKLRSANKTVRDLSPPGPSDVTSSAQLPPTPAPQLSPEFPQSSENRKEDESPLPDPACGPCPSVSDHQLQGSAKAIHEKEKNSTLPPQYATNMEESDPPPSVFSDRPCTSVSDRQQQDYQQEKAMNSRPTKRPTIPEEEEPSEDSTTELSQQNLAAPSAERPASSMTQEQPIHNDKEVVQHQPNAQLSSILPPQSDPVAPPVASCSSIQLTINQSEKVTRIDNSIETTEDIDILDDPDEEVAVVFANRPLKCAHCPSPTRPAFTSLAILQEHQRWKHKDILMEKSVFKSETVLQSAGKLESKSFVDGHDDFGDKTRLAQPISYSESKVPPKNPPVEDPSPCSDDSTEFRDNCGEVVENKKDTMCPAADTDITQKKNEFELLTDGPTSSRDLQWHHTQSHPETAYCSKCRQILCVEKAHSHVCTRKKVATLEQSP